ncbi:TPA: Fatty acyl-CoA reductase 2, variant 3 [Trebouxia sp. C0005]
MKQNLSSAYSVHRAFEGSAVLITGATGYLGSLVLEQLLRLGHIRKAYLLMRRSSGHSEKQRLNLLLSTPIFRLHNLKQIVHRLEIIPGDLKQPDCGISHADQAKLVSGVQYIVHSAASIRFDNDIHTDIALSYVAMKSLAELARKIHGLRCFMYVSTAYANAHSDLVTGDVATMEQLYPLRNAIGLSLDHASVVELLLGLPPAEAQLEVVAIAGRHSSQQNNYGFCKNLTEQLIGSYHLQPFPVCINRPVGIGAVAKSPCPGYVGNSAATGVILSLACGVGTLQSHDAELPQPLVPGDMAASIILASMASAVEGCSCMESPYVTHACAMARHPVPFGEFVEHICKYFR